MGPSRHHALVVDTVDIGHVDVSMDKVHGVKDAEDVVELSEEIVRHVIELALLPPPSKRVVIEARLSSLQNMKAHIVEVIVSEIDFRCDDPP